MRGAVRAQFGDDISHPHLIAGLAETEVVRIDQCH
jgi:hypothetical protein